MVLFDPNETHASILERARDERTTLTEFFKVNADRSAIGALARQVTYQDFPQHFVWNRARKKWTVRREGWALGRMYWVSPLAGERFYLRTLLTMVKGATSFEDLRTVNGILYPTFRDACMMRGLLEDDSEWRLCLQDAVVFQTGYRLRQLFATILLHCSPHQPHALWNEFRGYICDDVAHRLQTMGFTQATEEDILIRLRLISPRRASSRVRSLTRRLSHSATISPGLERVQSQPAHCRATRLQP